MEIILRECMVFIFFLIIRLPPRSTRTATPVPYTTLVRSNGFGKEHFFGKKAIEQWYTSHGCRRHHGKSRCNRHAAVKPREPAQVACARFVVDDAGCHEQRSLESGMVDHMEDGRHQRQLAVQAQ